MTRALTATLTALCIAGLISLPVKADDSATTTDAATTSDAAAASPEDKTAIADKSGTEESSDADENDGKALAQNTKGQAKPAKPAGGPKADIATRVASFGVCSVIGLPIALVRRTGIEIVQGNHDLIGDADRWYKKIGVVFPGFLSVPYGAISGGIGGPLYAVKNAWVGSGDHPFGKEAMSLGDIGN